MLNLLFWILLSTISFISLVTIWQREDLNFIEMKESYVVEYDNYAQKENKKFTSSNRNELNKRNKEKAMRFYDLEQRTHNNIIKYSNIKNNKRQSINLYPIENNKSRKADQGVA